MRGMPGIAGAAWEICTGTASFLFFRATRALLGWRDVGQPISTSGWIRYEEQVATPFGLARLMTTAPRWNPHIVAGFTSPFTAKRSITLRVADARASAECWTLFAYRFPELTVLETLTHVSTVHQSHVIKVPQPGMYQVGVRYYRARGTVALPEIVVDDERRTPTRLIERAEETSDLFYRDLQKRTGGRWFYGPLQHYVYPMLRFREWLPPDFVEREFLPVGNPSSKFAYGIVDPGERVIVELDKNILDTHEVNLTFYDRRSFPVSWHRIRPESLEPGLDSRAYHRTKAASAQGFYLVRVHPLTKTKVAVHLNTKIERSEAPCGRSERV